MSRIILLILMLCCCLKTEAQVDINIHTTPSFAYRISDLWKSVIINQGGAQTVTVEFTVNDRQNNPIIKAVTQPFTLNPGVNTFNASVANSATYNYFASGTAFLSHQTNMLPSGEFVICGNVLSANDGSLLGRNCAEQNSSPVLPPQLIYPSDEEEIYTLNPMLTWLAPQPSLPGLNVKYDLVLVQVNEGQNPQGALITNSPLLVLNEHSYTQFQYAALGLPLEYGSIYAWKVIAKNDVYFLGETDIWTFKPIQLTNDTTQEKISLNTFPLLQSEQGKIVYNVQKFLRFSTENDYAPKDLNIKVFDHRNKEVRINSDVAHELLYKVGRNKFMMPVKDALPLQNNRQYSLVVTDNVGRKWFLSFHYKKQQ